MLGDYVQHAGTGAACEAISTPGCSGMPDGPNPYPHRLLTEFYLMCQGNKTISTQNCVNGDVFDPIKLACTKDLDMCKYLIWAQNATTLLNSPYSNVYFV